MAEECATDVDCRVSKICASGECECPWRFGLVGDECNEFTAVTRILIAISCFILMASTVLIGFELVAFYRLITNRKFDYRSAAFTTLCFTSVGTFLMTCFISLRIWTLNNGSQYSLALDGETKLDPKADASNSTIAAAVCAILCASMNLTICWLEIAIRSSKMKSSKNKNISAFSKTVYGFCGLYVLCMIIVMGIGRSDVASIVSAPFFLILLILFYVSHRKLQLLLGSMTMPESPSVGVGKGSSTSGQKQSTRKSGLVKKPNNVQNITRRTTRGAVFFIAMGIISAIAFGVTNVIWESNNTHVKSGSAAIPTWGQFGIHIAITGINIVLVSYLFPLSGSRTESSQGPSASHGSSINNRKEEEGSLAKGKVRKENTSKEEVCSSPSPSSFSSFNELPTPTNNA